MKAKPAHSLLRYLLLVLLTGTLVLPLVWAAATALMPLGEVFTDKPHFLPDNPRWDNFERAWRHLPMARFMLNSMLITVPSVIGAVLTSAMAGYAFARYRWTAKPLLFALLVASLLVPAQLLLVPHFLMVVQLGWIDTYKPLIVPAWLGGGAFNVLLFRQVFRAMPTDTEDAARLEGAGEWMTFSRIALPAARPAVAVAALLSFVYHWHDFLRPLIYLSDFDTYPVSVGLRMYQAVSGSWMNLVMAASLIAIAPVLVIFLWLQRYLAHHDAIQP